jgi:hypothetical protein
MVSSIDRHFEKSERFKALRDWRLNTNTDNEIFPAIKTEKKLVSTIATLQSSRHCTLNVLNNYVKQNKVVRMGSCTYLFSRNEADWPSTTYEDVFPYTVEIGARFKADTLDGFVLCSDYHEDALATLQFILHLVSTQPTAKLYTLIIEGSFECQPITGCSICLENLLTPTNTNIQVFELKRILITKDICTALSTMTRHDVSIVLTSCQLDDGVEAAFQECIDNHRGPTILYDIQQTNITSSMIQNSNRLHLASPREYHTELIYADSINN